MQHQEFTRTQQEALEVLRSNITRRIQTRVDVDYGCAENGQFYALFCVAELPFGSCGPHTPLATIISGPGVKGFAVVVDPRSAVVETPDFDHAIKAALLPGVRTYRQITRGRLCRI